MNDPIAMLRADIDPIARAGLEKASELGKTAISAAKQKSNPPKRRRKWWLGPLLVLAVAGVVFAVKRNRVATDGGDAHKATGARMSVADSTPEPSVAEAR